MTDHQEDWDTIEELKRENKELKLRASQMLEALKDVESKIVAFEAGKINWRPDDFLQRVRAAIALAPEQGGKEIGNG